MTDNQTPAALSNDQLAERIEWFQNPACNCEPCQRVREASSRLRAAEHRAAELAAQNAALLSIVGRFVALPSGAWHPERHAAEEAELVTEARAAIDAARRLFGSAR